MVTHKSHTPVGQNSQKKMWLTSVLRQDSTTIGGTLSTEIHKAARERPTRSNLDKKFGHEKFKVRKRLVSNQECGNLLARGPLGYNLFCNCEKKL